MLPQTPRRASPVGGEGRGAGVAVKDVDMGGTNFEGVVPAFGGEEGRSKCDCRTILASVRREMAPQVRSLREEVMGALSLLLAERGLGMWEEHRKRKISVRTPRHVPRRPVRPVRPQRT